MTSEPSQHTKIGLQVVILSLKYLQVPIRINSNVRKRKKKTCKKESTAGKF